MKKIGESQAEERRSASGERRISPRDAGEGKGKPPDGRGKMVPQATVLPRSASSLSLTNRNPTLPSPIQISSQHQLLNTDVHPAYQRQESYPGSYGTHFTPLPAYPNYPHTQYYSSDLPHPPCNHCGSPMTTHVDDRGSAIAICLACRGIDKGLPLQKRGSWHGGDFDPQLALFGSARAPPGAIPYSYSGCATSIPSYPSQPSMVTLPIKPGQESSRWDSLRRAADSIIKEKDSVIEKQRQQIQQLEELARQHQDVVSSDKQHLRQFDTHFQQLNKDLDVKMQEFQYETAAVRASLAEATASKKMEIDDLTRKLAETELSMAQNQASYESQLGQQQAAVKEANSRLMTKQSDFDELRLKYKTKEKELSRARKNLSNIETYLAGLPTPQEVEETQARIQDADDTISRMKLRVQELEGELEEARGEAEAKATVIQSLEQAEEESKNKLESWKRERDKYREMVRSLRGLGDSDSGVSVEDMEDEMTRAKGEADRLKKLLDAAQKRHKVQEKELRDKHSDLEEQFTKQREKVSSLEQKLRQRDSEVERLRDRVADDDAVKESLRERVSQLAEELTDAQAGGEEAALNAKIQGRISDELSACLQDLQGLIEICNDEVEGKDPNMSVLLGLGKSKDEPEEETNTLDATTRLAQVKTVRKEVDRLRSVVSNKIAENMGDNLDCTQQ